MTDVIKTLEKLPICCLSTHPTTGAAILLQRGVQGYMPFGGQTDGNQRNGAAWRMDRAGMSTTKTRDGMHKAMRAIVKAALARHDRAQEREAHECQYKAIYDMLRRDGIDPYEMRDCLDSLPERD